MMYEDTMKRLGNAQLFHTHPPFALLVAISLSPDVIHISFPLKLCSPASAGSYYTLTPVYTEGAEE